MDPWGHPYRVTLKEGSTLVEASGTALRLKDLTPEERKALEDGAAVRLADKERADISALMDLLGADDAAERDRAQARLKEWGRAAADLVAGRERDEKDPEIRGRLRALLAGFPKGTPAWSAEMKPLRIASGARGGRSAVHPSNERNAGASLRTITTAQADFRANDRDENGINDFWARDISGLYAIDPTGERKLENIIKLIEPSLAGADTSPNRQDYGMEEWLSIEEPTPKAGYFFSVLARYALPDGREAAYDDGTGRNRNRFGAVAYPAEYGTLGVLTFIVNEDSVVWWKDLEGETIEVFPADPAAEGWKPLD